MRRLFFIVLFSVLACAQSQDVCPSCTVLGGHLVAGGHAILGNFGGNVIGAGAGMQYLYDLNVNGCSGASCSFVNCSTGANCLNSTTAGAAMIIAVFLPTSAHITSAYLCTVSSGCTSGNATATFTLCPATNCAVYDGTMAFGNDLAYLLSVPGGSTYMTVNLSASQGSSWSINALEVAPPTGYSFNALDSSGASSNSSCSPCTLATPTLTATDLVFQFNDFNGTPAAGPNFALPYITDNWVNAVCLDCNTTTAPVETFASGTGVAWSWIALTTTAGFYTSTSQLSIANHTQGPNSAPINCSPACAAFTIPSTTAGDLLRVVAEVNGTNTDYISSVSGCGGSWVTSSSFQNTTNTESISTAYNLNPTGGCTSITVTMNKSNNTGTNLGITESYWQIHKPSGAWTLDTAACTSNASGTGTPGGQALTLNNTTSPHVIFQTISDAGGAANVNLYPWTYNGNITGDGSAYNGSNFGGSQNYASDVARVNTIDGSAPIWQFPTGGFPATGVCANAWY